MNNAMTLSAPTQTTIPASARIPRYEVDARVVAHNHIVANEYEIRFEAPAMAQVALPGQFLELLYNDSYAPLIRRPFSIYGVDRQAGTCSVLYQARGSFTSGLAQKRPGDRVSLLGPLGNPFRWSTAPGIRHILIAGGIGAPPLVFLAGELCRVHSDQGAPCRDEIIVLNGARTRELLVGLAEFGEMDVTLHALTDDGSHGRQGRVTDLLHSLLQVEGDTVIHHLYACGPMPMLRAVGDLAIAHGVPCQISVETSMPCGIGTCNGCAIPVRDSASATDVRPALACVEGPVFDARDLVWSP
jgi:dihydroorotate dehydrogenase electron transfer subunit